jgi:ribonuclease Y
VVTAIQELHPDADPKSVEGLLLRLANRLSDNRPGARKDNLAIFVERLRRLEGLACSFPGVTQAFALKAGKELRVLVDTRGVSDDQAYVLSRDIARAIERDLDYPGPIRVSVVRRPASSTPLSAARMGALVRLLFVGDVVGAPGRA